MAEHNENAKRVVVFIDESNVYRDARRCFFDDEGPGFCGRIKPMRYAMLLADLEPLGSEGRRELHEVRVYGGTPSRRRDPATYDAHQRQVAEWRKREAVPILRPLRYPGDWPTTPAQQKGVDVQLALDVVVMGLQGLYDVAIIASTDTDLRPAIEGCHELGVVEKGREIEVAAWRSKQFTKKITVADTHVWCHFLGREDYDACRDTRDYGKKIPASASSKGSRAGKTAGLIPDPAGKG